MKDEHDNLRKKTAGIVYPNGGSETYIFKLGEALEQHGHEVQYFGIQMLKKVDS